MEIMYCDNCGAKVTPAVLSGGACRRTDEGKLYCPKCAPLYEHTSSVLLQIPAPVSINDQTTQVVSMTQEPASAVTKFYFCETCGKRITDKQILEGLGRDKKLKGVYCKDCAVGVMTMEMDAINIHQLAKAQRKTPSPPPCDQNGVRHPLQKGSRIVRANEVPQRHSPKIASLGAKGDKFPLFVGIACVVVIAVIAAVFFARNGEPVGLDAAHAGVKELSILPQPHAGPAQTNSAPVLIAKGVRLEAIDDAHAPPMEVSLDLGDGVKMELMLIPAGEFEMGSRDGPANEKPIHKVKITHYFYMGKYVVTQAQYEKVMGSKPTIFKGEVVPITGMDFMDAEEFCKTASKLTGNSIRLPTEAEWEYACRAGTKTKFNTGDSDADMEHAGWFEGNSLGKMHSVGQKEPNAWGLYDMHGNVCQWCQDWYADDYYSKSPTNDPQGSAQGTNRVLRGGGWNCSLRVCRSACRIKNVPDMHAFCYSCRVALVPASKTP